MTGADHRPGRGLTLDAYCDGRGSPSEREALERRLDHDSQLREALERRRAIDDELRRRLAPPAGVEKRIAGALAGVAASATPAWRPTRWAAAAIILIVLVGGGAAGWWAQRAPSGPPRVSPATAYAHLTEQGFVPAWVCADDAEFLEYTARRFGEPLLATNGDGVEILGWSRAPVLSYYTGALLTRVDGSPVVVLVGKASEDRALRVSGDLSLFRRRIGDAVLYEITPLPDARALDRFHQGESP